MIVYRFEVLALHHVGGDTLIVIQPYRDVAYHVLDEFRIVVGALGDEFLVRALENAVQLARRLTLGQLDQLFDLYVGLEPRLDGHVRTLVVGATF